MINNKLIGVNAKIGHGKDTVGKMILDLTSWQKDETDEFGDRTGNSFPVFTYEIRKFAEKLKEIVALLIGVSRADLEKEEVKNMILPSMWDRYLVFNRETPEKVEKICVYEYEAKNFILDRIWPYNWGYRHEQMTPRLLLQLIGTECGRDIIHPNIWVNSTFADYKEGVSKWVITDTRFPNEADAIKNRSGLVFRINRPGVPSRSNHPSETALDSYALFDEVITNDGTEEQLKTKVKLILQKYEVIK